MLSCLSSVPECLLRVSCEKEGKEGKKETKVKLNLIIIAFILFLFLIVSAFSDLGL